MQEFVCHGPRKPSPLEKLGYPGTVRRLMNRRRPRECRRPHLRALSRHVIARIDSTRSSRMEAYASVSAFGDASLTIMMLI